MRVYLVLIFIGLVTYASESRNIIAYETPYISLQINPPWVKVARVEAASTEVNDDNKTDSTTTEIPAVDEGNSQVINEPAQQYYLAPDGSLMVWDAMRKEFRKSN